MDPHDRSGILVSDRSLPSFRQVGSAAFAFKLSLNETGSLLRLIDHRIVGTGGCEQSIDPLFEAFVVAALCNCSASKRHTFVDELEAAQKATEKIHELREQLDRLRALVYATHGLGGGLYKTTCPERLGKNATGERSETIKVAHHGNGGLFVAIQGFEPGLRR